MKLFSYFYYLFIKKVTLQWLREVQNRALNVCDEILKKGIKHYNSFLPISILLCFSSPCLRRCSTIFLNTRGTPSSTRPFSRSSNRDAPNSLVCLDAIVRVRSMGIWTIFFMSSLTCTAVLLCCRVKSREQQSTTVDTNGHRRQRWSRHQVRHHRDTCPGGGRLTLLHRLKGVCDDDGGGGGVSVESIHAPVPLSCT